MRRLHVYPLVDEPGYLVTSGRMLTMQTLRDDDGRKGYEVVMRDRDAETILAYAREHPDWLRLALDEPITAEELEAWVSHAGTEDGR